jgi:hypothetical protein
MRHPILRLLLAASAVCSFLACTTSDGGDEDGPLPSGHYLILTDQDDSYDYTQYFVVQPGSRWEFVEYGVRNPGGTVCRVTRSRGLYRVSDSLVSLTGTEGGDVEKCPVTQADFDGLTWEAAPPGASETFSFRNVTDSSFEARNMLAGTSGWQTYRQTADPYGYFD